MRLDRIISGGQTGADRGGLDAAIARGISHGGWCPRGRRAEDGLVPLKYDLQETSRVDYKLRTVRNIAEADATIVFTTSGVTAGPGTRLTLQMAMRVRKPFLLVELARTVDHVRVVRTFLRRNKVRVPNVAGSRESRCPGIQQRVKELLIEVLS